MAEPNDPTRALAVFWAEEAHVSDKKLEVSGGMLSYWDVPQPPGVVRAAAVGILYTDKLGPDESLIPTFELRDPDGNQVRMGLLAERIKWEPAEMSCLVATFDFEVRTTGVYELRMVVDPERDFTRATLDVRLKS